jgi:hypothetical protein
MIKIKINHINKNNIINRMSQLNTKYWNIKNHNPHNIKNNKFSINKKRNLINNINKKKYKIRKMTNN